VPAGKVNTTDPDSRSMPLGFGFVQGYNAQAAVNEQQIVLAAEITNSSTDFSQLDPMVTATLQELERAGVSELPEAVAADAGYWNEQHMDEVRAEPQAVVTANKHIPVLIPPDKGSRGTPRPGWTGGRYAWMRTVLATEHGRRAYRKRRQTVEPLFGNTKHNNGVYALRRSHLHARPPRAKREPTAPRPRPTRTGRARGGPSPIATDRGELANARGLRRILVEAAPSRMSPILRELHRAIRRRAT